MGNSSSASLNVRASQSTSNKNLGNSDVINLSTKVSQKFDDGGFEEYHSVVYKVDGSACDLMFTKKVDKHDKVNSVKFTLSDRVHIESVCFDLTIQRTATNSLEITPKGIGGSFASSIMSTKRKRTFDARGDIVDTEVNLYGSGNRGGFVVLELKKNSRDEKCNAATLAHYFANSDGAVFSRTGKDIGLSVVVKILASNGNLDIVMEGPQKHPSAALFYMFNEVYKTGIWKPTMCPHCSNVGNDGALVRHGKTGIIILEDEDN